MLSPEEKEMLANIKALISQIETMEGGEEEEGIPPADDGSAPPVAMAEDEIDGEEEFVDDEEEGVVKSKVKKGEGSTGSDDSEDIIDDQPEMNEENIKEVAKALLKLGLIKQKKKAVAKSKGGDSAVLVGAIAQLTKVIKSIQENQNEHKRAIEGMLEGLGIANSIKPERVAKSKPVAVNDTKKILSEVFKDILGADGDGGKNQNAVATARNNSDVRKSIGTVMQALVGRPTDSGE